MKQGQIELLSRNPSTGQIIWTGEILSEEKINDVVKQAKFNQPAWEQVGVEKRKEVILNFAQLVKENAEEAATIIAEENGKPLWEARTEVNSLINKVQAVFDAFDERAKERIKDVKGRTSVTRFRAHGVMVVLGPYNFPMSMPNSHVMPALLAGNAVVFKPSERVPKSAEYYVELWHKAGVPSKALQVIHGDREIGNFLIGRPEVNGVLFIGSRQAGVEIQKKLAEANDKISALEMGGNNPLVVWDYNDVRVAVHIAIQSAFVSSGQRCSSARRMIINREISKEFVEALKVAMGKIVIGKQFDTDPAPFMGPLIDQKATERFIKEYQALISKGASEIVPTELMLSLGENFVKPALVDVTNVEVDDIEVFGPLLQMKVVEKLDDAIFEANNTQFGLASGIITKDKATYKKFYIETKAGIINWNQPLTGATTAAPFGGAKASGNYRPAGYLSVDYCSYPCASIEDENPVVPEKLPPGLDY